MDDCNLEKLSIKPGKLSPVFHMDTLLYGVTVASNVEKVTLDPQTRDTGASSSIWHSDGSRTIPLKEGEVNIITIEVTAENGTAKKYIVNVKRLSAKDATLSNIRVNPGSLEPEFAVDTLEYHVLLPADKCSVLVTPNVPDSKSEVFVNGEKPDVPVDLNLTTTPVNIKVTSPDGSNTQTYKIIFVRKQIPRYIRFNDPVLSMQYECPVSLTALYQPVTIKDSEPRHTISGPIIDEFTKTSKVDPISEVPLVGDWRVEDFEVDKKLSEATGCIPLATGGTSEAGKLSQLGTKLKDCHQMPKLNVEGVKYSTDAPFTHSLEVRGWEKQLRQIFDESNVTKLSNAAGNHIQQYYDSLPKPGRTHRYEKGQSPIDILTLAAHNYATAIKSKATDPNLHLQLGLVLEEMYYAEDIYGLKTSTADGGGFASMNAAAVESSKEEECDAICVLRNVPASSPLAHKLKAIDQEYHHLLESGQSGKADHVQALFQWKSKQATQEGAASQKAADDKSTLGQASLKFHDALSVDEAKSVYHYHVGRMLVIQGEYEEAVNRLEAALGWNEKHQMAKFYLGFGLCLRKEGPGSRTKEVIGYLAESLEVLLHQNTEEALNPEQSQRKRVLKGENIFRNDNVHLLRSFIELGKLLRANPDVKDYMSAQDVFHSAALLASQVLATLVRGDTYQQVEWVLLEAHSLLLEILLETQSDNKAWVAQRSLNLSALIKRSTIPHNQQLMALQIKTCQMLVEIQPCNSLSLYMLGNAQLTLAEGDPDSEEGKRLIEEAKESFKASISLEGKPAAGDPPEQITGQKWWQDKIKAEEEKKAAEEASKKQAEAAKGAPATRGGATGRGGVARGGARGAATTPARGGAAANSTPAAKGAPASRGAPAGRGGALTGRGAPAAGRGGASTRGAPAARGGAKAAAAPAKPSSVKGNRPASAKGNRPPSAKKSTHSCEPVQASQAKAETSKENVKSEEPKAGEGSAKPVEKAAINKKLYLTRLGLARATAKHTDDLTESKKYYNEVIDLAPQIHDAYIESAELLTKKDPMGAVDIYCRFPVSDDPTFDDAYIFGEVVRLLMKNEKFDDPRLGPSMISLGKVMGLPVLEKHLQTLDNKFKIDLLKSVYAGVNGRSVDDPDMQAFFKAKCWM